MNKSVVEKSLLYIKGYTERVCASRDTQNTRALKKAVNALIGEFNTYDEDYNAAKEADALRELLVVCFLKELPIGITLDDVLNVPADYYKRRMVTYSSLGVREAFLKCVLDYKNLNELLLLADECKENIFFLSKMISASCENQDVRIAYEHALKSAEESLLDIRDSINNLYN